MPIGISITGLTPEQQLIVANAFDETIDGRLTAGPDGTPVSKARWVEINMGKHLKAVVKGWYRRTAEASLSQTNAQVDADFQE